MKKSNKLPFSFEEVGCMVERQERKVSELLEIKKRGLSKTIREERAMYNTILKIWMSMKNPNE
jgi:hypothetical protein